MPKGYKRTYKGLLKKAIAKNNALKYPNYQAGDKVRVAKDIMEIDERITGPGDGYIGPQVRRRQRYRYLLQTSARGVVDRVVMRDIYVKFKVEKADIAKKYGLDKPILIYKQMLKLKKKQ